MYVYGDAVFDGLVDADADADGHQTFPDAGCLAQGIVGCAAQEDIVTHAIIRAVMTSRIGGNFFCGKGTQGIKGVKTDLLHGMFGIPIVGIIVRFNSAFGSGDIETGTFIGRSGVERVAQQCPVLVPYIDRKHVLHVDGIPIDALIVGIPVNIFEGKEIPILGNVGIEFAVIAAFVAIPGGGFAVFRSIGTAIAKGEHGFGFAAGKPVCQVKMMGTFV